MHSVATYDSSPNVRVLAHFLLLELFVQVFTHPNVKVATDAQYSNTTTTVLVPVHVAWECASVRV